MNPFLINNYEGAAFFCDREQETLALLSNFKNNRNTTIFAQRRIGKTALIQHLFTKLKSNRGYACLYLDIYATQNLKNFTNELANAIYKVFPENLSIGKKFREAIKLLRPIISIDSMSGAPELSLDISKPHQFEKTIPQLLQFLDSRNIKILIAIDEFQQILNYPEKNVEALLRTCIQQLKNVNFIFCGSNQNLMHHIFHSAKRPFYASTATLHLEKIATPIYADFIKFHFAQGKKRISEEAVQMILELTKAHTYYTQMLCHTLFASPEKKIGTAFVLTTLAAILRENEGTYFQYRNLLTPLQWILLKSIAKEDCLFKPYSKNFVGNYHLGSAAIVKRGLDALLQKEMVYYHSTTETPYYEVHDEFLAHWLKNK